MAARMDPYALVGTTIGQRYSVDFFVGVGRFSVVYRGTQIDTLRPVALKFLKVRRDLERSSRTVVMQRLHDAKATLGDIAQHCPTFCEILDTSALVTADGRWVPFAVQSWLDGTPLESELVNDALHGQRWRTLSEAIDLLAPVADALAYAHARGVIHGGLAPRSLYLQNESMEWRVTDVLDLGVADVLAGAQKDARSFVEDDAPLLCFAPAYGAPEQFSNVHGDVGPATDVYALALIVVELLVGRAPLGDGDDELLEAVSTDPSERPTPAALGLDVGAYVEAVLARALAVEPDQRYATITAFWDALRAAHRMTLLPSASAPSSMRARASRIPPALASAPAVAREIATEQVSLPPSPVPAPSPAPRPSTPHHPGFPASMPPLPRTVLTPPLPMPSDLTPIPPSIAPPAMARDVLAAEEPEVERTYAVYARAAAFAAVVAVGLGATYTIAERSESGASQSSAVADAVTTPARAAAAPACPEGMIAVPGGRFYMGSDDDVTAEKPAHAVTLTAYCIDASEVTADRYRACSDEGKCKRTAHGNEWRGITKKERDAFDPLCTTGGDTRGRGQHPANCVSWEMASAFCAASGARLPTEAEWEFAARGPDGRRYPWGDEEPTSKHLNACGKECVARGRAHGAPEVAMFKDDDHFATTAPVGSFPIGDSRFGLHDMAGNVREWTADLYGDYTAGAQIDPTGPASGDAHVIRGGAWDASRAAEARATLRDGKGPDTRSHGIGFRCARSLTP